MPLPRLYELRIDRLALHAEIGVNEDERGRRQSLLLSARLRLAPQPAPAQDAAGDVLSYMDAVDAARSLAAEGHIGLLESFAHRLAQRLFQDPRVLAVDLTLEKPEVLGPAGSVGVRLAWDRAEAA